MLAVSSGTFVLATTLGVDLLTALGWALFSWALTRVAIYQDRPLPIQWMILLVASLQWIVAPSLAYSDLYTSQKYYMYVDSIDYMAFAVPGVFALAAGILAFSSAGEREIQMTACSKIPAILSGAPMLPFVLLGLSVFGSAAAPFVPGELGFVAHLMVSLKYSSAILLILSHRPDRNRWVFIILLISLVEALASSLFNDIIAWLVVVGAFYASHKRFAPILRFVIAMFALIFVLALHSVKGDYRSQAWYGGGNSGVTVYGELLTDRLLTIFDEGQFQSAVADLALRLNQGWIISRVMSYVPAETPFADGRTVTAAAQAALLPRFLAPDKAGAGGKATFEEFTGFRLVGGTSMGISQLGEAWANFGYSGGIVFMGAYGLFVGLVLHVLLIYVRNNPFAICLFPNVVFYLIRAENDLVSVFNYLFKSAIFHIGLCAVLGMVFVGMRPVLRAVRHGQ